MSKYIWTREDGERVVVDLDEDEARLVEAAMAADDDEEEGDDDDEEGDDYGESEPSRAADTPEEFARVEAAYRKERAAIRASVDATDLRLRRHALEGVLRDVQQSNIAHARARDLLDEIEQRELRLRAERLAARSR